MLIQGSARKSWQPQLLADGTCPWIQSSAWKSWQPQWLADGTCLEAAHAVPELLEVRRYDMPQLTGSFDLDDQFMLGPSILVAPVMQEAAVARTAFLPPSQRWSATRMLRSPVSRVGLCWFLTSMCCSRSRHLHTGMLCMVV